MNIWSIALKKGPQSPQKRRAAKEDSIGEEKERGSRTNFVLWEQGKKSAGGVEKEKGGGAAKVPDV